MAKPKAPENFLYTLMTGAESFIITKWDSIGMEQLSQYIMPTAYDEGGDEVIGCTCPQGLKPSCRHRKMLPRIKLILDTPHVMYRYGDDRFLGLFDGSLRPLSEQEQSDLLGTPKHPLSAEEPDGTCDDPIPIVAAAMYGSGKHSAKEVEVAATETVIKRRGL